MDVFPRQEAFPRREALAIVRRMPAYGLLAWRLSRDPALPAVRRGAVIGAAAYLLSPIDAVPGIVPLLGQLDDLVVIIAALRFALAGMNPSQRHSHLQAAGLSEAIIAADQRALADIAAWLAHRAARLGARVSQAGRRAGVRVSEAGLRAGTRAGEGLARLGQQRAAGFADAATRLRRAPSALRNRRWRRHDGTADAPEST